jgi:hypothetical protein
VTTRLDRGSGTSNPMVPDRSSPLWRGSG